MAKKNYDVAVLNTLQASGADIVISNGKVSLDSGAADQILPIQWKNIVSYSKTSYAAGTAEKEYIDFTAITPAANTEYTLSVKHNGKTRTYSMIGKTAPTNAAAIVTAIVADVNNDPNAVVTAVASTNVVQLTMKASALSGGGITSSSAGASVTTNTAFVAPAGSAAEVEAARKGASQTNGEYTKYSIIYDKPVSHNAISGQKAFLEVEAVIYVREGATNFSDLETDIDQILAQTASSGSRGLDTASIAALAGSVKNYITI
tara:strand:- start:13887 stop:14669 length:783 start_codon:yes stop_codon:yes gene_type:complete